MSKYKIDIRLQADWQKFGLDPDEIEWISDESFFSTGEKEDVWDKVDEVLTEYEVMYKKDMIQKSRKQRARYKKGIELTEEEAAISNNPNGLTSDYFNGLRSVLRGLIGL